MNARVADTVFFLLCLGAVLGNAAFFRARAAAYAEGDSRLLAEADGIIRAFVGWCSALLLVIAAGAALGLTTGPFGTDDPSHFPLATLFDKLYAVAYFGVLARASWWVYAQGGAGVLARHHAMFRLPSSRFFIMLLWAAAMGVLVYGLFARLGYAGKR